MFKWCINDIGSDTKLERVTLSSLTVLKSYNEFWGLVNNRRLTRKD